jgi:peptidoglycan/LPS O-acetylase OafA/YrhL
MTFRPSVASLARTTPGASSPAHAPPSLSQSLPFRKDIEGLRGVAVLIVVAFHCGLRGFGGGFVGVDVFFTVSGYLITGLLVAEFQRTSSISLVDFYARRVRRLLPAAALVLACTLIVSTLLLAPQELSFAGRAARATAVYVGNVFFAANAADYFSPNVETNPLLHMWTLAVEEQFYVVWPLLIMLGLRHVRSRRLLVGLLAALAVLSLAVSAWATDAARPFAFYQLPSRAWEFALGGLAALFPAGRPILSPAGRMLVGWCGLASIALFQYFLSPASAFPGWLALGPAVGTAVILVAGAGTRVGVGRLLHVRPLQFLGKMSYSWYLWHWPFLVLAAALFPGTPTSGKLLAVLLALGVAALAHRWVENPIRFHHRLVDRPRLTLAFGAMLMVGSLSIAQLSIRVANGLTADRTLRQIAAAAGDIADMPRAQCVSLGRSAEVRTCTFGDRSSPTTVVLFGDSHAIQWFNALERMAVARSWKLTTVVKSGCAAADATLEYPDRHFVAICSTWRHAAIDAIAKLHPAVVVMGSSTGWRKSAGRALADRVQEWQQGTQRTLIALSASNARVLIMRDTPAPPFDVPACLARSARHAWYPGGSCAFARPAAVSSEIFASEQGAAAGMSNVRFIDMTPALCSTDRCTATLGDAIAYRDDNHLTGASAATLEPPLERALLATVQLP